MMLDSIGCVYIIIITINNNKQIFIRFIYLLPYSFVYDLRFREVLQTTIIRQIMKRNEEIEKYS